MFPYFTTLIHTCSRFPVVYFFISYNTNSHIASVSNVGMRVWKNSNRHIMTYLNNELWFSELLTELRFNNFSPPAWKVNETELIFTTDKLAQKCMNIYLGPVCPIEVKKFYSWSCLSLRYIFFIHHRVLVSSWFILCVSQRLHMHTLALHQWVLVLPWFNYALSKPEVTDAHTCATSKK